MAWYQNNTRFSAIVTIRILVAGDQEDSLKVGIPSNLKKADSRVGIHDYFVGADEVIEISQGINAEFLAVRNSP